MPGTHAPVEQSRRSQAPPSVYAMGLTVAKATTRSAPPGCCASAHFQLNPHGRSPNQLPDAWVCDDNIRDCSQNFLNQLFCMSTRAPIGSLGRFPFVHRNVPVDICLAYLAPSCDPEHRLPQSARLECLAKNVVQQDLTLALCSHGLISRQCDAALFTRPMLLVVLLCCGDVESRQGRFVHDPHSLLS